MSQRQSPISNAQGVETQRLILEASGRVFGEKGYAGACFREISQESGIGLSSIVYHFKSKKNLYLQTIRHFVVDKVDLNEHFRPIRELDDHSQPLEIANALRDSCRSILGVCHGPKRAVYMNELYTGIMTGGDPEALGMLLECFVDVQRLLPETLHRYWPDMAGQDIAFWVQLFWSQLQYTIMGRTLVLYDMNLGNEYPEAFLDQAAWYFAKYCCLPLGLPLPTPYKE